jgi:hypothetical protein
MPALRIVTDKPVECRLLTTDGVSAPSNFGVDQIRYRTDLGDLYVSPAVGAIIADAITKHGIEAGRMIRVLKATVDLSNGRKGIRWSVEPVGAPAPVAAPEPERKPAVVETAPSQNSTALNYTMTLIDAYAAAVRYANEKHSGVVTPERVWSIFATVVIGQQQRNGNGGKSYAA